MNQSFQEFADTLSREQRGTLLSAAPLLTALVARADGQLSLREKVARWRTHVSTRSDIDPSFVSDDANTEVELYLERLGAEAEATTEGAPDVVRELRRLRAIIQQMPDELAARFESFLLEACLGVASASGRFLFFGEQISPEERGVLRLIVRELGLTVTDPSQRDCLEFD